MLAIGNRDRVYLMDAAQSLADHGEPTRQGSRHRQNAPFQRMQTKELRRADSVIGQTLVIRLLTTLPGREQRR
jgi:hypothetical protein